MHWEIIITSLRISILYQVARGMLIELAYEKSHLYSADDGPLNNGHALIALRQKLKIANLEKGCFAFNTQAAKAIQQLNLVNWKQGDSSDIAPFFGRRTFVYNSK